MLAAEDARDPSAAGVAPLLEGLRDPDVETQRRAVRALGRFEDVSLVPPIQQMLSASEASVRAEAANALAQAYHRAASGTAGAAIARAALSQESHALVRGALLLALGRFTYTTLDEWRAAEVLITDTLVPEDAQGRRTAASPAVLLNGLRGLQFLARQAPGKRPLHQVTVTELARLARPPAAPGARAPATTDGGTPTPVAGSRIRLLALQALRAGNITAPGPYQASMHDPDPAVRRVAMVPLMSAPLVPPGVLDAVAQVGAAEGRTTAEAKAKIVRAAAAGMQRMLENDPSATVRLEALRGFLQQAAPDCRLLRRRLDDTSAHVVLMAIDGMVAPCRGDADAVKQVASVAAATTSLAGWHRRAHALVALAQMDAVVAAPHVRAAARDQNPWVRMYAARALRHLVRAGEGRDHPDVTLLRTMTADASVNVATAAVEALRATVGHAADMEYLAAVARDDRATGAGVRGVPTGYELVVSAAKALGGSAKAGLATPLLDALDRLSSDRRETSRDPRKAIIEVLASLPDPLVPQRLRAYATDFDPVIAQAAAALVTARSGVTLAAAPVPLPRAPLPTAAELDALTTTNVVLQMADGTRVTVGLLPNEAPLNALRFVRLAESGYFTGRTIHRVVRTTSCRVGARRERVRRRRPVLARRGGDGVERRGHRGRVDARTRHGRRAVLREPRRQYPSRSQLHGVRRHHVGRRPRRTLDGRRHHRERHGHAVTVNGRPRPSAAPPARSARHARSHHRGFQHAQRAS